MGVTYQHCLRRPASELKLIHGDLGDLPEPSSHLRRHSDLLDMGP